MRQSEEDEGREREEIIKFGILMITHWRTSNC
jgi:hypothetical protein